MARSQSWYESDKVDWIILTVIILVLVTAITTVGENIAFTIMKNRSYREFSRLHVLEVTTGRILAIVLDTAG